MFLTGNSALVNHLLLSQPYLRTSIWFVSAIARCHGPESMELLHGLQNHGLLAPNVSRN